MRSYKPAKAELVNGELKEYLYEFLDYCRIKNLSINTIVYYRNGLAGFFLYCQSSGIQLIADINSSHIRAFINRSIDDGISPKTINHRIQVIKRSTTTCWKKTG